MVPEDAFQREVFRRELDTTSDTSRLRELPLELYDLWPVSYTHLTQPTILLV